MRFFGLSVREFVFFTFFFLLIASSVAYGQDVAPVADNGTLANIIIGLVAKFPILAGVLVFLGGCRIFIKPVFALLHSFASFTKSKKDDAFMEKVQASKILKSFIFCLDWLFSVKIIK